ncbi:MAG: hypothetical protein IJA21_00855 [Clostridia bacterium]|nr:hypothetical protein [Clostridia bacterium]
MNLKKITSVVSGIIIILVFISFFVNANDYQTAYNIWAEKDDMTTNMLVMIVVVLVVAIIIAIVAVPTTKRIREITKGKRSSLADIKKNSLPLIKLNILGIIIFCIISEKSVCDFAVRNIDMSLTEAKFLAGYYQLFKEHFLWVDIVLLIDNIILFFTAKEQDGVSKSDLTNSCEEQEDEKNKHIISEKEQKEIKVITLKARFVILAILIILLIITYGYILFL